MGGKAHRYRDLGLGCRGERYWRYYCDCNCDFRGRQWTETGFAARAKPSAYSLKTAVNGYSFIKLLNLLLVAAVIFSWMSPLLATMCPVFK